MISREPGRYLQAGGGAGILRIGLYIAIVLSPLGLSIAVMPKTDHPFVQELAKGIAATRWW